MYSPPAKNESEFKKKLRMLNMSDDSNCDNVDPADMMRVLSNEECFFGTLSDNGIKDGLDNIGEVIKGFNTE